jgi:hypothetical protein
MAYLSMSAVFDQVGAPGGRTGRPGLAAAHEPAAPSVLAGAASLMPMRSA